MTLKHTTGPWAWELRYGHGPGTRPVITAPSADRVAICSRRGLALPDVADANADRIVACVNACEGIPTDALLQPGMLNEIIGLLRHIVVTEPESEDDCILIEQAQAILNKNHVR